MSTMIDWIMLAGEKAGGGDNLTFEFCNIYIDNYVRI
jgi:hypothetical protein